MPKKTAEALSESGRAERSIWAVFQQAFWLLYFFATIGFIGAVVTFVFYVPLAILGLLDRRFHRLGESLLKQGVRLLLFVQPWLQLDSRVIEPDRRHGRGTLLIANHRSTLDVYLLLATISGIQIFTNRKLLFAFPLIPMLIASRQILVKNGDARAFLDAMQTVRRRLSEGENVHVFPELTRCQPGFKGTNAFTVAPFLAAIQEKADVLPIAITGTDAAWPKGRYGLSFRPLVTIRSLEPIDAAKFSSADELRSEVRRQINEAVLAEATA